MSSLSGSEGPEGEQGKKDTGVDFHVDVRERMLPLDSVMEGTNRSVADLRGVE